VGKANSVKTGYRGLWDGKGVDDDIAPRGSEELVREKEAKRIFHAEVEEPRAKWSCRAEIK